MAKPLKSPSEPRPEAPAKPKYLPWPASPKECSDKPRRFRVERLNAFEWQAFVTSEKGEEPIGKPDVFDIVMQKVKGVVRIEGQRAFLEAKTAAAKAIEEARKRAEESGKEGQK